jgi:archaellum biogenesis ATPase FlaH
MYSQAERQQITQAELLERLNHQAKFDIEIAKILPSLSGEIKKREDTAVFYEQMDQFLAENKVKEAYRRFEQLADLNELKQTIHTINMGAFSGKPSTNAIHEGVRMTLGQFAQKTKGKIEYLIEGVIAPGKLTEMYAPTGTGKTLIAQSMEYGLTHAGSYLGRPVKKATVHHYNFDMPDDELMARYRCFDFDPNNPLLKIVKRDECVPLTDKKFWSTVPFNPGDVFIIDSWGPATRLGVKQERETQEVLKTLTDLCDRGAALVILGNTTKDRKTFKGIQELEDRADIFIELRDATDFTPTKPNMIPADELMQRGERDTKFTIKGRREGKNYFQVLFCDTKMRSLESPTYWLKFSRDEDGKISVEDISARFKQPMDEPTFSAKRFDNEKEQRAEELIKEILTPAGKKVERERIIKMLENEGIKETTAKTVAKKIGVKFTSAKPGQKSEWYFPVIKIIEGVNVQKMCKNTAGSYLDVSHFDEETDIKVQISLFLRSDGTMEDRLTFKGLNKPLRLTSTMNLRTLNNRLGTNTDTWPGATVTLGVRPIEINGRWKQMIKVLDAVPVVEWNPTKDDEADNHTNVAVPNGSFNVTAEA